MRKRAPLKAALLSAPLFRLQFSAAAVLGALCSVTLASAETNQESDIKFAWYSSAWGANTDDGLRLVAYNQTNADIVLERITFLKSGVDTEVHIDTNLAVSAGRYADMEIDYIDLIADDECIERTMAENWKLVEISNYTLNPSVRNLIIENTDSFRIYQCVEDVVTHWTTVDSNQDFSKQEWVLFHFESKPEP